jgi:DNA-binding response OmpR family regulator
MVLERRFRKEAKGVRILLIEDDEVIAERTKAGLDKAGFTVDTAADGEEGLVRAQRDQYALIILDVMLPKRDGWRVCEALRAARNPVPILMVTARDEIEDRVRGLESGADDYLPKPFDFRELLARIRALLRRDKLLKAQVIKVADLEIDAKARTVRRGGQAVNLTPHEYSLLEALARNAGRTLSREEIQERVWYDDESYSNVVSFHIAQLRKKIDGGRSVNLIQTVHGVGYVFQLPEDEE